MGAYNTYILYALIFTTVVLMVEGAFFFVRNHMPANRSANHRMKLIEKSGDDMIGLSLLKDQAKKRSDISAFQKIDNLLMAADLKISAVFFILICVILTLITALITSFMGMGFYRIPILSVTFGIFLPVFFVRRKAKKRRELFAAQLIPSIDLVSRGLQAGHPAAVALEIVAKEMPDPIGSEFGMAIDEMNYGLDRNTALSNMAKRFPDGDLKFFVSALEIQRETGGNLVEVLNNLSDVMRARQGMVKKIAAMSSEGKLTMRAVGFMPFGIGAMLMLMVPGYYSQHYGNPMFTLGMAIPFTLYLVGMWRIKKMINIRI